MILGSGFSCSRTLSVSVRSQSQAHGSLTILRRIRSTRTMGGIRNLCWSILLVLMVLDLQSTMFKAENTTTSTMTLISDESSVTNDTVLLQIEPFGKQHLDNESSCECWNTTENFRDVEVECRCRGPKIKEIPHDLASGVHRITLEHAGLETLKDEALQPYAASLREIVLMNVPALREIEAQAFARLTELRTVYIDHAPLLKRLPYHLFNHHLPSLRILRIVHTGIELIPHLSGLKVDAILHMVDLESNQITRIHSNTVRIRTQQFLLNYNKIEEVENHAFDEAEIAKLSLKGNRELHMLQPDAFVGLRSLRELDLSETSISQIPTAGLKELEILRLEDTTKLKVIPSIYNFEYLTAAYLNYPYHCCAFQYPAKHDPEEFAKHELIVADIQTKYCAEGSTASNLVQFRSGRVERAHVQATEEEKTTTTTDDDDMGVFGHVVYSPDNLTHPLRPSPDWGALAASQQTRPDNFDPYYQDPHRTFSDVDEGRYSFKGDDDVTVNMRDLGGVFHPAVTVSPRLVQVYCGNISRTPRDVVCRPIPDAFNPCEDMMGNWWLRVAVWFVVVAAVLGNLAVLLVLLSSRFRMTVPKFLMCNLALADLCMGTYLLLIAAMDARSIGAYFNYAIDWQEGLGCQIAGFLTVFASELSIFTLTVITSERWYAITYALHLDKRLKLGMAARIMAFGWIYSLAMATLPLLGISGYSKTSICLPMENSDAGDLAYLVTLLLVNGLAFVLICACYGKIYCTISNAGNPMASRSDLTVAKRMALLVFTDFACWAPIAFFGLTAVAGYPLIDVTGSKILLVFFYPLNSCANPYLYAILTKQYRRDLATLLRKRGYCSRKATKYKGNNTNNSAPIRKNTFSTSQGGNGIQNSQNASSVQCVENLKVDWVSDNDTERRLSILREASSSSSSSRNPRGSPHPLRNSTTKLHLTGEQEMLLRMTIQDPNPTTPSVATTVTNEEQEIELGPLCSNTHV